MGSSDEQIILNSDLVKKVMDEFGIKMEDVESFKRAFDMFDSDDGGAISASELGSLIRSLGHNPTDAEVSALIKSMDKDDSGTIEFPEFLRLMGKRLQDYNDHKKTQHLREAFKVFDKDGSGKITADELRLVLTLKGQMKLTDEEVDEMIAEVDLDGDGQINYEEFVVMFS